MLRLTRIDGASFGLTLNDFSRVTAIAPKSAAEVGGVCKFDLITHVNGLPLEGKLSVAVQGQDAVELTVERPPCNLYKMIASKENAPGATSPLTLRTPGLRSMLPPLPSSPLKERSEHASESQSPDLLRASEALAAAAGENAGAGGAAAAGATDVTLADGDFSLSPPSSPSRLPPADGRAGRGHRRNSSEPVFGSGSPMSAALQQMQADPFWGRPPAGWSAATFDSSSPVVAAPAATPAEQGGAAIGPLIDL